VGVEASTVGVGGGVSGEVKLLLANVSLQDPSSLDVWLWRPNAGDDYTVRGVYQMLMRQEIHDHDAISEAMLYKNVPLKVSICAWRLFP